MTDANNCVAILPVTITQPTAALALSAIPTPVACYGGATGAINLSVSGGTLPYTYSWSNGPTTEDLSGLTAGTYTVTVTDANNCVAILPVTITQPTAALALSAIPTPVACYGGATGAIDLSVSGGTTPYTYSWTNGAITEDISGLVAGTYTVTVTDANSCVAILPVTITQPTAALALSAIPTPVACYGDATGAINLSVSGGTTPYTYSWTNGAITEDISGLVAGTYTVTVTDANNCVAILPVTITQPTAALALSAIPTPVACYGDATGAINLSVSGGTTPYTYSWTNGAITEDISGLVAGTYTVTVTDANNCVAILPVTITQPTAALALSAIPTPVACYGDATGAINLSVSGGTTPYTYSWTNGAITEDISGLVAGTYTVTVTDANNCVAILPVTITQPLAAAGPSAIPTPVACYGDATGAINLSVSGGTLPYTYSWSNGPTTEDISGLVAGTYTVTVTDANNCVAILPVTITQPLAALALSAIPTPVACYGGATGAINLSVSGGTTPYTYSWSNGPTTEDLSGLTAGTYTVTVTDANNCVAILPVTISQPLAALALSAIPTPVACYGDATGAINLSVSGGTTPYTYSWTNGAITEDISGLVAGTYTVTVTDANNCVAILPVTITQPTAALALSAIPTPVACYGDATGAINLSVSGGTLPYTYSWTNGAITEDISGLVAGTYTVTVTDANSCVAILPVTITRVLDAAHQRDAHGCLPHRLRRHDRRHGQRGSVALQLPVGRWPDHRGSQRPRGRQLHAGRHRRQRLHGERERHDRRAQLLDRGLGRAERHDHAERRGPGVVRRRPVVRDRCQPGLSRARRRGRWRLAGSADELDVHERSGEPHHRGHLRGESAGRGGREPRGHAGPHGQPRRPGDADHADLGRRSVGHDRRSVARALRTLPAVRRRGRNRARGRAGTLDVTAGAVGADRGHHLRRSRPAADA